MTPYEKQDIARKLMSIGRMLQSLAKEVGDIHIAIDVTDTDLHFTVYDKDIEINHIRADWYDVKADPDWAEICDENGWVISRLEEET
jgi:hypothetical protein